MFVCVCACLRCEFHRWIVPCLEEELREKLFVAECRMEELSGEKKWFSRGGSGWDYMTHPMFSYNDPPCR